MAFHFPLQAVLHLRQSLEHQQELRLRAANQQVSAMRHLVDAIDLAIRHFEIVSHKAMTKGIRVSELHFNLALKSAFESRRQQANLELHRAQNLRDQQQRIFQQLHREREILEALRDQQLQEYERAALRRQQSQTDELFLLRRAFQERR
ncbi:MAG TPA: flagellar FliJ family protein [Candidatus Acidoferrales bacterium]|nr:flagellar FliJ family protein [Candidatus Acidoferrales bacterium]